MVWTLCCSLAPSKETMSYRHPRPFGLMFKHRTGMCCSSSSTWDCSKDPDAMLKLDLLRQRRFLCSETSRQHHMRNGHDMTASFRSKSVRKSAWGVQYPVESLECTCFSSKSAGFRDLAVQVALEQPTPVSASRASHTLTLPSGYWGQAARGNFHSSPSTTWTPRSVCK